MAQDILAQFPTTDAFFIPVSEQELRDAAREGRYIYCNDIQNNNTSGEHYYLKNVQSNDPSHGTEIYSETGRCVDNPQPTLGLRNQMSGSIYDSHILYSDGDQNVWHYDRTARRARMILDKYQSDFRGQQKFRDPGFFSAGKFIIAGDDRFFVFRYDAERAEFEREYDVSALKDRVIYAECPFAKNGRIYFSGNGCPVANTSTGVYSVEFTETDLQPETLRRENISPDLYTTDGRGTYWIGNWNYNKEMGYRGYTGDYFNARYVPDVNAQFETVKLGGGEAFAIDADCEIVFRGRQFNLRLLSCGEELLIKDAQIFRRDVDNWDYNKRIDYVGFDKMLISKKYVALYAAECGVEPCLIVFKSLNTQDLKLVIPFDTEFSLRKLAPRNLWAECRPA